MYKSSVRFQTKMAKHNTTGKVGEDIVAKYLEKKGFSVIDRNYRKKWGELDIVAEKNGVIHFVEVKTVNRRSFGDPTSLDGYGGARHFEQEINNYKPEDNMHPWKIKRLQRALQTYLLEKFKKMEPQWQFDLACVFLDQDRRVAKIKFMADIVL